jgi:hypothetical protein
MSENRMLRRIFGPKREEDAKCCIMRRVITWTLQQILLG